MSDRIVHSVAVVKLKKEQDTRHDLPQLRPLGARAPAHLQLPGVHGGASEEAPGRTVCADRAISHSGVRVTLADGSQWLVHKGNNFGISSNTVVVVRTLDFRGTKKVADFVAVGGTDYSVFFDNCHLASRRMMGQ
ncbi:putative peptidyl-prolyl cis-trans isomerase SurA [Dissostichus eleginoides]|uniref:Peptidyl-prolyl cis-trans isomerase SurA n=1 Tax=Dissostichus eleginoides TaxID=100907 RepID=A0AAD9F6V9_DISEL|nr:putative peptidyl-prolyl cis-trans isomerase SurA [Dissostichus eleginoides]